MIVNPSKKKDYVMAKIDQSAVQKGIAFDEMKQLILSIFPSDIPQPDIDKLEFGYIEPGHGLKGRKEWILDDDELLEFLERCEGKKPSLHSGAIAENPQRTSKPKGDPSDQDQSPPQLKHPISLVPHSMISILQRWLKWMKYTNK
ncbi:MAG: hypothetical protein MJE68_28160 [Proteobacteria bacterium]|nr:hypothetical protein [Pseudomonadota bacterium]